MSDERPAITYCRNERERLRKLLSDLEAGSFRLGKTTDGVTLQDATAEQITLIKGQIDELTSVLDGNDRRRR
jgi:hypothetical protein